MRTATTRGTNAFTTIDLVSKADAIKGPPRAVLYGLAKHADGETGRNAYPSHATLEKCSGVGRSSVSEALRLLEVGYRVIVRTGSRANGKGRPTTIWEIDHEALRRWDTGNQSVEAVAFRAEGSQLCRQAAEVKGATAATRTRHVPQGEDDLSFNLSPTSPPLSTRGRTRETRAQVAVDLMVEANEVTYGEWIGESGGTQPKIPFEFFDASDGYSEEGAARRLLGETVRALEDPRLGSGRVEDGLLYLTSETYLTMGPTAFLGRLLTAWRHPETFTGGRICGGGRS